jgi:hypothetical protein
MDKARARGLDIEFSYQSDVRIFGGDEAIGIRGIASHIIESSTTSNGVYLDAAGQTGLDIGRPRWQGILNANYANGPLSVSVEERGISSGQYDASWKTGVDIDDNHVNGALYTTLDISYRFDLSGAETRLFFNVANLFDKAPPLAPAYNNFFGSTYSNKGLFDEIGRRFTAGLSLSY